MPDPHDTEHLDDSVKQIDREYRPAKWESAPVPVDDPGERRPKASKKDIAWMAVRRFTKGAAAATAAAIPTLAVIGIRGSELLITSVVMGVAAGLGLGGEKAVKEGKKANGHAKKEESWFYRLVKAVLELILKQVNGGKK